MADSLTAAKSLSFSPKQSTSFRAGMPVATTATVTTPSGIHVSTVHGGSDSLQLTPPEQKSDLSSPKDRSLLAMKAAHHTGQSPSSMGSSPVAGTTNATPELSSTVSRKTTTSQGRSSLFASLLPGFGYNSDNVDNLPLSPEAKQQQDAKRKKIDDDYENMIKECRNHFEQQMELIKNETSEEIKELTSESSRLLAELQQAEQNAPEMLDQMHSESHYLFESLFSFRWASITSKEQKSPDELKNQADQAKNQIDKVERIKLNIQQNVTAIDELIIKKESQYKRCRIDFEYKMGVIKSKWNSAVRELNLN